MSSLYGHGVDWSGPTLLDPIPTPPPPERIESPGGRLVVVHTAPGVTPHRSQWAVILAWAAFDASRSSWACLMVWDGWRLLDGRERAHARWGWVRWRGELVVPQRPYADQLAGLRWFGRAAGDDFEAAYVEAAGSLPEPMRAVALEPVPYEGAPG